MTNIRPEYSQVTQDKYAKAICEYKRHYQFTEQLLIRFSQHQKDRMLTYCKQKEITVSSFIRCCVEVALAEIEAEEND
jgi:hypothetical protein